MTTKQHKLFQDLLQVKEIDPKYRAKLEVEILPKWRDINPIYAGKIINWLNKQNDKDIDDLMDELINLKDKKVSWD